MIVYLDASALVKRYVAETGSEQVRAAMASAEDWFSCRLGFVETVRAVGMAAGRDAVQRFSAEWPSFSVVEVDQRLVERAGELALARHLRSLDAVHLAAALLLPRERLSILTWDERLHGAALAEGLTVLPETLS